MRYKDSWFDDKMRDILDRHSYLYNVKKELKPWVETMKVIILYVVMGGIWITTSDRALLTIVQDQEVVIKLQTYKGWLYVLTTGLIFYFIIKRKIILFNKATEIIFEGYEELSSAHEELIAMEEELHQQFNELKNNRDALRESNQRYQLVVEGANDGIWDWDIRNNTDFFSITSKDIFGFTEDELERSYDTWKELIHPDDREKTTRKVEQYLEVPNNEIYQNTYRLRCKSGEYRWILSRGKGMWDENGQPIRMAGSHTDITELIELEETLRREKEISQKIINGSQVIIAGEDTDGNIIEFNPFTESLTGYTREEVLGKNWVDMFIPKDKTTFTRDIIKYILSGKNLRNEENQIITKKGEILDILWNNNPIYNNQGEIAGMISTGIDITERKKMEEKLYRLAYYDTLTGLPNRDLFDKELTNAIKKAVEDKTSFMLVYMDLDNFKNVNDTLGHTYGDMLIGKISENLENYFGENVMIARLGGDEFAIILPCVDNTLDTNLKILEIMKVINKPWIIDENELYITCSVGIAIYPRDGLNVSTLMKNADTAMYAAKENGKNCYAFYSPEMNEKASNYMEMEKDLRNALNNKEFTLYYQPIIDLKTDAIVAVEGLVRWIHPKKGLISPVEFIPFAEESGLILELGESIICMACEQLHNWKSQGYKNIKMSINLSARQLMQYDLADRISYHITEKNINSDDIVLEITENAALVSFEQSINTLNKLKDLGVKIALDDFGTGYSSLNYLKQLPVDIIKIDKSFIKDIHNKDEKFIAKTVIDLAHNLNLSVTAEGIETIEQLNIIKGFYCDHVQGYYYSKPVPADELKGLLSV